MDRYTLREAERALGGIDHNTLLKWLDRVGIEPERDEIDRRRRLLTYDQLKRVADMFGRTAQLELSRTTQTKKDGESSAPMSRLPQETGLVGRDLIRMAQDLLGVGTRVADIGSMLVKPELSTGKLHEVLGDLLEAARLLSAAHERISALPAGEAQTLLQQTISSHARAVEHVAQEISSRAGLKTSDLTEVRELLLPCLSVA
jgi:hypothetical protein